MKTKERAFTQRLKDKLLTEMTRQGLNGQKLSTRSKVSDSEISRILSGQSTPGLENAFRLAKAVNVSLDYLADDGLDVDPLRTTDPLTSDERRVLELVQRIGLSKSLHLLENISFIGYEASMQRLLTARPTIEIDADEQRPTPTNGALTAVPTPRTNTA